MIQVIIVLENKLEWKVHQIEAEFQLDQLNEIWLSCNVNLGVDGIQLLQVSVPSVIQAGEEAVLLCDVDLEGDVLYSVKWYWFFLTTQPNFNIQLIIHYQLDEPAKMLVARFVRNVFVSYFIDLISIDQDKINYCNRSVDHQSPT